MYKAILLFVLFSFGVSSNLKAESDSDESLGFNYSRGYWGVSNGSKVIIIQALKLNEEELSDKNDDKINIKSFLQNSSKVDKEFISIAIIADKLNLSSKTKTYELSDNSKPSSSSSPFQVIVKDYDNSNNQRTLISTSGEIEISIDNPEIFNNVDNAYKFNSLSDIKSDMFVSEDKLVKVNISLKKVVFDDILGNEKVQIEQLVVPEAKIFGINKI
jgi:hypothetical protein